MRTVRAIGFLVLALAGAALVWFAAGSIRAARRERVVEAAWAESLGPIGEFASKFPAHPTNAAARALEESARSLGIDLRPRGEQPPEDEPGQRKKTEFDDIRAPLQKWVDQQASKAEGLPDAPPAPVATYFASHAATLDAIEQELLEGPAPEWAVDLAKLYAAPEPNIPGQVQLTWVLLGRAEARAVAKDRRADESLRAAFTLTGALRGRPEIASQLTSMAATHLELAAVRRIPVDAATWHERLKALDPRGGMLMAFRRGAWVDFEAAKGLRKAMVRAGPLSGRLAAVAGSWRERIEAAGILDARRVTLDAAAKSPVSEAKPLFLGEVFQKALKEGGVRTPLAVSNLIESWRRANLAAIEIRKTDELLAARATKPGK